VPKFSIDVSARTLTLDHELLRVEWGWSEDGAIDARSFRDLASGVDWIDPAFDAPLFVGSYELPAQRPGFRRVQRIRSSASARFEPPVVWNEPDGTARASWRVQPDDSAIVLTWQAEAIPGHAVLRQWFEIENTGAETAILRQVPVFAWAFGAAGELIAHSGLERRDFLWRSEWPDWYSWNAQPLTSGAQGQIDSGYRKAATWLALAAPEAAPGLFFGWETNGEATCRYGDLRGDGLMRVECVATPEYQLAPGQTLTGPAGFVGAANGELDELSFRCQRFAEQRLSWRVDDERFPYVAFNSWGYGAEINEEIILSSFDRCRALGIELLVVDFGWEDPEWKPLASIFPNGLKPISEAAHDAGMLFGIHLSFGNCSNLSQIYAEHPEWGYGPGQWAYRREGEVFGLTLGNPATRAWLVNKLVQIIDENGVDYFLTDHYLWGWVNPDAQTPHASDNYLTIVEGYDQVIAEVRARRPHVQIEHCDNGLAFPTFKMVQQHMTSIGSDAAGSLWERVAKYRISRVLPPRFLDSYVSDRPTIETYVGSGLSDYDYRSHLFGGPMILMTNITTMEPGSDDWQTLDRNIKLYKRIRKQVLDGKVLHLLAPHPIAQLGRHWDGWDAIGSYHAELDQAVIFIFRLGGDQDERIIPLHGLNPNSTYRITYEDRPDVSHATGADLMANGLPISLPSEYIDQNGMPRASDVVFLTGI
jgi:hypothetical protein